MSQEPFEILEKAELLFSRGNYREALELLDRAEKAALENNTQDALAAIYHTVGNNLADLGDFENAEK
ncbi:MAG: tetratricopeptide repeat protein, partial [Candidatus Heimdallarchaeaceae archaeon]